MFYFKFITSAHVGSKSLIINIVRICALRKWRRRDRGRWGWCVTILRLTRGPFRVRTLLGIGLDIFGILTAEYFERSGMDMYRWVKKKPKIAHVMYATVND